MLIYFFENVKENQVRFENFLWHSKNLNSFFIFPIRGVKSPFDFRKPENVQDLKGCLAAFEAMAATKVSHGTGPDRSLLKGPCCEKARLRVLMRDSH